MRPVLQSDSPLVLLRATHGRNDLLEHAVVRNLSKSTIRSYRMGWIVVYRDAQKKPEVHPGELISVQGGIKPKGFHDVPSQRVPGSLLNHEVRAVMFFVAEVQFDDGRVFKADTNQIVEREMPRLGTGTIAGPRAVALLAVPTKIVSLRWWGLKPEVQRPIDTGVWFFRQA